MSKSKSIKLYLKPLYCYKEDMLTFFRIASRFLKTPYVHIPVSIIVLVCIIFTFPLHIVPDYWGISTSGKAKDLLGTIISSVTEIIGIVVAVILLSFEFFRQSVGEAASHYFISNRSLAHLISWSLSCIFLGFFSQIYLPNGPLNTHETTLVYINIYVWIITLLLLFPLAFKIITSFNIEKIIQSELLRIKLDIPSIYSKEQGDIYTLTQDLKKDPIVTLQGIAIKHIHNGEKIIPQLILFELTKKITDLIIISHQDDLSLYLNRLIRVYTIQVGETSGVSNPYLYLQNLNLAILYVNETISEHDRLTYDIREVNLFLTEHVFGKLLRSGNQESLVDIVDTKIEVIKRYLKVSKDEAQIEELWVLYRKEFEKLYGDKTRESFRGDENLGFHYATYNLLDDYTKLLDLCLEYKNINIYQYTIESLHKLTWLYNMEKQPLKAGLLSIRVSNIICTHYPKAFRAKLLQEINSYKIFPFDFQFFIKQKPFYLRKIFNNYCHWILQMQKEGYYNKYLIEGIDAGILSRQSEFNTIATASITHFESWGDYDELLKDIIYTFQNLIINFKEEEKINMSLLKGIENELIKLKKEMENRKIAGLSEHIIEIEKLLNTFQKRSKTTNKNKR